MTLLTVKEVAARLQMGDKTIYAWASQGKIPSIKIHGVIRFHETEIEEWLQRCHLPMGLSSIPATGSRRHKSLKARDNVDALIENAKREVHTLRGETRPVASPCGREGANGTR
jgi:excisionase family DNA binding protein